MEYKEYNKYIIADENKIKELIKNGIYDLRTTRVNKISDKYLELDGLNRYIAVLQAPNDFFMPDDNELYLNDLERQMISYRADKGFETKSLYEYFNCRNKEELLYKIKNNDEAVRPLIELYEQIGKETQSHIYNSIGTALGAATYSVAIGCLPKKDYITILVLNVKNRPISSISLPVSYVNDDRYANGINIKAVIKKCYSDVMNGVLVIANEKKDDKYLNKWKDALALMHIRALDVIYVNHTKDGLHELYSVKDSRSKNKPIISLNTASYNDALQKSEKINILANKISFLQSLSHYDEFTAYYTTEMLKGLNIVKDKCRIRSLLCMSCSTKTFEEFGCLCYDKNGNILDNKIHTRGDNTSATVNRNAIIKELINDEVNGIIIYHNHPSTDSSPSKPDILLSTDVEKMCLTLNKHLYDSLIISKNEVYSMADNGIVDIISKTHNEVEAMFESDVSEAFENDYYEEMEV